MKPFLAIDLTNNKNNESTNGSEFLVAQPSSVTAQVLEDSLKKAEETIEQAKLPLAIRVGQWICGAVGALVSLSILKALGGDNGVSLEQAYRNADWLFWLGGGCLIVWLVLKAVGAKKAEKVFEREESSRAFSDLDGVCNAIFAELSVPANAKEVDILSFFYKVKNGNINVCQKGMQMALYLNPVFRVFSDSEYLYIANLEGKYAFPLNAVKSIHTVKKHIIMNNWNKSEPFNEGIYKQYKLTSDNFECIHCKLYYILEIDCGGETWGIYFPCYELPVFEELMGLRA